MRVSLLYLALNGSYAGQCCLQPLISRRGGRCLLLTEITLPYQISGGMKFVCLRMVVAVNQTHINLFFTSLSLEGPCDGSLTGSSIQAGDLCCNAAILCIHHHIWEETAAESGTASWDFSIDSIIWSPLNDSALPLWNSHAQGCPSQQAKTN